MIKPAKIVGTVVLAALAMTPSLGLTAAQAASAPYSVVTPAQAAAEVRAYLVANNKANSVFNLALQNKIEGGSAAAIDDAFFRIARAVGLPPFPIFSAADLRVYVPRQTRYPAMFVALYRPKLSAHAVLPDTRVLLFQRGSSHSAWKLTNEPDVPASGPLPVFTVDKAGYIPSLQAVPLARTRDAVTRLWLTQERAATTGLQPSKAWTATPLLLQHPWSSSLVANTSRSEVVETDAFVRAAAAPACIASRNGALCFVSTLWTASVSLTTQALALGHRLAVTTTPGQYPVGGVAKGRYLSLRVVTEQEAVIEVPRLHSKRGLRELADAQGALTGSGVLG